MEFTYLGDRVCVDGGCETVVTARTRYGWVMFRECGELLCGWRLSLWLNVLFMGVMYGQQYCMKVRWEFYE